MDTSVIFARHIMENLTGDAMMMIAERLKDHDRRLDRLEREYDEFTASSRNAVRQLVGDWVKLLMDATQNPNINWSQVNLVIDKMREFACGEVKK